MTVEVRRKIKLEKTEEETLVKALFVLADLEDLCEYSDMVVESNNIRCAYDIIKEVLS